jgi:hypothetical protein
MNDAEVIGTGKWHTRKPDRNGHQISHRVGWCERWGRKEDVVMETVPALELKSVEREYPGR